MVESLLICYRDFFDVTKCSFFGGILLECFVIPVSYLFRRVRNKVMTEVCAALLGLCAALGDILNMEAGKESPTYKPVNRLTIQRWLHSRQFWRRLLRPLFEFSLDYA